MSKNHHVKKTYTKEGRPKRSLRLGIQIAFLGVLLLPATVFAIFAYYAKDLPRPEKISEVSMAQPTKIYDRTGNVLLYEVFGDEKREVIPLSDIPEHLQRALIATEDAEFYGHFGLSVKGTARALLINLGLRESSFIRPGGSTLTQQLARNSFLTREKTVSRKVRELILTLELERQYSKNDILGFYLNQIPFGSTAYGIAAASDLYFQKKPSELSVAESATLVAMIQAPTYYSPNGPNKEALLARKDYVLSRMAQVGFLSQEEADEAKQEELVFQDVASSIRAPHFSLYVLDFLVQKYGEDFVRVNGLRVTTSLDWELQQIAEKATKETAQRNAVWTAHNAALVALDPKTGEILAMVGSADWNGDPYPAECDEGKNCFLDPKLNVITYSQGRQPGSAFKPFVYALAFDKGASGATVVLDEETSFGVWGGKEYIPQNYDNAFRGEVTLRNALAQSINIPAVKVLLDMAGIQESVEFAKKLGMNTLREPSFYGPALVLGGAEVRPLDIVSAYGVFATEGKKVPPLTILGVQDVNGNTLEKNQHTGIQVMNPAVAKEITSILSDNEARAPLFGPRSALYIEGYQVAAKTGTTQDYRDAWTIGYTKDIVAGVWAGNNDGTPANRQPGAALASPLWNTFMTRALPYLATHPLSAITP